MSYFTFGADEIDAWARFRSAEDNLPRLVRRLITATSRPTILNVAAGTSVRSRGWDGVLDVAEVAGGNVWVPLGSSVWEISAGDNAQKKANENYSKRLALPPSVRRSQTFVFVTASHWDSRPRDAWLKRKMDKAEWANVVVIEPNALESWLETDARVHFWFAELTGHRTAGAQSLERWWSGWSDCYPHVLPPAMLRQHRDREMAALMRWLDAPAERHSVRARSRDEGIAFVAATLHEQEIDGDSLMARTVIVESDEAWDMLVASQQPLVLIPLQPDPAIAMAIKAGHHVLTVSSPDEDGWAELDLPNVLDEDILPGLRELGISPARAAEWTKKANGEIAFIKRQLREAAPPLTPWLTSEATRGPIVAALMAGSWDGAIDGDRATLARLASNTYESAEAALSDIAAAEHPQVQRRGSVWFLTSREDAWRTGVASISDADWDRFAQRALDVLVTADPAWELPPGERWLANVKGKAMPHSSRLRRGLATTLAMLGGWRQLRDLGNGRSGPELASSVVGELFDRLNRDATGALWSALGDLLPLLAEAAPFPFIQAVGAGLEGEQPVLSALLEDSESGGPFGRATHSGILWALEALAWSPDLLGPVAKLLARWAALDPGGRWANRPANTFREVFLPGLPQTMANNRQRLAALERVRHQNRDSAWPLLRSLLPHGNDISMNTNRPKWMRSVPTERITVTRDEYVDSLSQILDWLMEDARASATRLVSLVEAYADLPSALKAKVAEVLSGLDPAVIDADGQRKLADALRDVVSRHRSHHNQAWAISPGDLEPLDTLRERMEPSDPIERIRWLFETHPDPSTISGNEPHRYMEALQQRRTEALAQLFESQGWSAIERLAESAEDPWAVGWALAELGEDHADEALAWLAANGLTHRAGLGYLAGRINVNGWDWAAELIRSRHSIWGDQRTAEALAAAPNRPGVWDFAEELGVGVEGSYWRAFQGMPRGEPALRVARKLLAFDRPFEAVEVLGAQRDLGEETFDPHLTYDALTAAAGAQEVPASAVLSMFRHSLPHLLDSLEAAGWPPSDIAGLEWTFLAILGADERPPTRLGRMLASDPGFFVEVITAVFRATGEPERALSDGERRVAEQAFRLLMAWRDPPGVTNGSMDEATLFDWIGRARALLADKRRVDIGDQRIGHVLWWSPIGADGVHPHEAVRAAFEALSSDQIEIGFSVEAVNSRGVVWRGHGGDQEREIASGYRALAEAFRGDWPRTSALFDRLAERYDAEAVTWDNEEALREVDQTNA